jgi:Tol biopolymer transport system component
LVWWLRRPKSPETMPGLTRVTSDPGLTFQPAISLDGKLLAYVSDRGQADNLDIWVQQMAGSAPIRITTDPAVESDPVFSPNGGQIAFRSEREGGGIYVAPALGGEARLIAPKGKNPRFSPDGRQIAYWVGSATTNLRPSTESVTARPGAADSTGFPARAPPDLEPGW